MQIPGFLLFISIVFLFTTCKEETAAAKTSSQQPASLSYYEAFDSMQRVINKGWKAVNLSNPPGADSWQQGSYIADNVKGGPFFSGIAAHSYTASANELAFVPYTCGSGLSFINCFTASRPCPSFVSP